MIFEFDTFFKESNEVSKCCAYLFLEEFYIFYKPTINIGENFQNL